MMAPSFAAGQQGSFFAIMGIVNLTPDSFSDGGRYLDSSAAIDHALQLIDDGADYIDLGAESTRPGAQPVEVEEEWRRLAPVLRALVPRLPRHCRLSIDTRKPELMLRSLQEGATVINNVQGDADEATLKAIARFPEASYIAMHMHRDPASMQQQPLGARAALLEVESFFAMQHAKLLRCGFKEAAIFMDPGIGFGKNDQANLHLMAHTPVFAKQYNLVLGISRKSWIGRLLGIDDPERRDPPSKIAEFTLALAGAKIIRTHKVRSLALLRRVFTSNEL